MSQKDGGHILICEWLVSRKLYIGHSIRYMGQSVESRTDLCFELLAANDHEQVTEDSI
jgi:hypothetical protein